MRHPGKALYILLSTFPFQTMGMQSAKTLSTASLSSANGIRFTLRQEAITSPLVDEGIRLTELVERKCEEGKRLERKLPLSQLDKAPSL